MTLIITPEWTYELVSIYLLICLIAFGSGIAERKGWLTVKYSKFRTDTGISSRVGMFILYFVPLLMHLPAVWYFVETPLTTVQLLLSLTILLHFAKRCFEVLFVHRYFGPIDMATVFQITCGYSFVSIYSAYLLKHSITELDLLVLAGLVLFVIGQAMNYYHHQLLANLRDSQQGYFIPEGALFEKVTCPHYFFEVLAWFGIALICRHLDMFILALVMANYLAGRSVKAHQWYLEKFPDYPQDRKYIIPYLY